MAGPMFSSQPRPANTLRRGPRHQRAAFGGLDDLGVVNRGSPAALSGESCASYGRLKVRGLRAGSGTASFRGPSVPAFVDLSGLGGGSRRPSSQA